ncbi:MAG: leucine-rich repeat protein [Bacteroidales bacterium]|nr:leucine-rich repeat protein [Bacteroidales bacterium]
MKNIIAVFATLMFAAQALAEDFTIGGLKYTITDAEKHEVSVSKGSTDPTDALVIPASVTYPENNGVDYTVTTIGEYAFRDCSGLTSVSIPNSVISIGKMAFRKCSNVTEINVGSANSKYTSKNGVLFNKDMTTLICYPAGKSGSYTIPNTVTSIGEYAFYYCDGLTSISIPNSITTIGDGAFSGCSSLQYNEYDNALYLGNNGNQYLLLVYAKSDNIKTCEINSDCKFIHSNAFYDCSSLTSITIPNSVTNIDESAFWGCSSLKYNEYDNALYLGNTDNPYLFLFKAKDTDITSVEINNNCKFIEYSAFSECRSLASVTIGNSVTTIGNRAFVFCSSLTSITIPNSVTNIGDWSFANCSSLKSVTIPNSVTSIGEAAFNSCESLTSVTIGNSVTTIGNWAFAYCSSLKSVTIPISVTSIGVNAFSSAKSINYAGNATGSPWGAKYFNYEADENGLLFADAEKTQVVAYIGYGTDVSIPKTVTSISDDAFSGCRIDTLRFDTNAIGTLFQYKKQLKGIYIGASVTELYQTAFWGCDSVSTLWVNTDALGTQFAGKKSLESLTIGDNVTTIPERAFYNCYGLENVVIPSSVTKIGKDAFGCDGHGTCGDDARWTYDILSRTITISGTGSLYDFNFKSGKEQPWEEFKDKIESVVIEEGINDLANGAFQNCKNLKYISLPKSCSNFGGSPFAYCWNLQKVTVRANHVSHVTDLCFSNYDKCTLYVPMDMLDYYKDEIVFKDFSKIVGFYEVTIDADIEKGKVKVDKAEILPDESFTITAIPDKDYCIDSVYVDGKAIAAKDGKYTVDKVNSDKVVGAAFKLITSGKCGENAMWNYDEETGTLTISGTGDMYDYEKNCAPWITLKNNCTINKLIVEEGITSIGDYAFYLVSYNDYAEIASTVKKIGKYNFLYGTGLGYKLYTPVYIMGVPTSIDETSFMSKTEIEELRIPFDNMNKIIESKVFDGFVNLKAVCTIGIADGIENGSISVSENSFVLNGNEYEKERIYVTPDDGYELESITANGVEIEPDEMGLYEVTVDKNIVLNATFKPIGNPITYIEADGISISTAPGSITIINANAAISVYDMAGRLIMQQKPQDQNVITVGNNGLYIVRIGSKSVKVMVK